MIRKFEKKRVRFSCSFLIFLFISSLFSLLGGKFISRSIRYAK